MLNVLVAVDHAVGISGPHRNVVGSLNALAARDDVSVRLLCGRIDEREPYAKSGRVDIRLGFDPHRAGAFWTNLRKLRECSANIDVIYCPSGLKALLYAQTIRRGKRLVASPNVTPLPIRRADSPGWIELTFLCDLWLEASRGRFDHVMRYTGSPKLRHVPHAINTETFTPARRDPTVWGRYGIREDSVKVLFVGRDSELRKGVPQLLDSAEIFNHSHMGEPVDFVLVGRMSEPTQSRAANLPNVHLPGFRAGEELAAIYASADISVIPSSWENFAFTVLEAMASGLAVIGSDGGGIPEQIEHNVSGTLVDIVGPDGQHSADAGEKIARAISELVGNPARRQSLGAKARQRVLECFSEQLLGSRLMAVLTGEAGPWQVGR